MATAQLTATAHTHGVWRPLLALQVCKLICRTTPHQWAPSMCRAVLLLSWFTVSIDIPGRKQERARLRVTVNDQMEPSVK